FAPMAAAIALNAEFGRRGRQAIEMMTGVSVGIVLGAVIVAEAGSGVWQILVVTFVALVATTAGGAPRMVRTQAASSGILVVALYGPSSNLTFERLEDAAVGGAVAILISRLLLLVDAPEPARANAVAVIEATARAVRAIEPEEARKAAQNTRETANRLREIDDSIGAGVVAHGAVGVAEHTLRAARAREEERRLAERPHRKNKRVPPERGKARGAPNRRRS